MTEIDAYLVVREHLIRHLAKGEDGHHLKLEEQAKHLDFYLEEGCPSLDIEPNTGIELKQRFISDSFSQFRNIYDVAGLSALIVIVPDERKEDKFIQSLFSSGSYGWLKGRNVRMVGLYEFLLEHEGKEYVQSLIVEQSEKIFDEKSNNIALDRAKHSIRDNAYTLFFGAGVSASAGLPGWDALLKDVAKEVFKTKGKRLFPGEFRAINEYAYCSNSPLILAQYLTAMLDSNDLPNYVRKTIYKKEPDDYKLIDALIELIKIKRPESIVTYNYDDLFEERAKDKGLICHPICDDNRVQGNDLPVYHVHGILPWKDSSNSTYRITLDEKSYHYENKDAFLWSNIEQMHALRRTTCVFIGLSMTDPNLRRLLDISREFGDEETYHYVFLKAENLLKNNSNKDKGNMVIFEKMLKDLGVQVIWYKEHFQLPDLIKQLA